MNRQQRTLAAGLFVVAWGTNVSTPLILRYQDRLGLSDVGAVGIFTVYVGGILLSLLFAGRLSDRFGRRPLILPFTATSAVASMILIWGRDSLLLLFAGRLLLGAVSGAVLSVGTAWLIELADGPADNRGRLHLAGVTTVVVYVGFGFGPITSAVYERLGPSPLVVPYLVHAGTTLLVLAGMWGLPETKPKDSAVSLRPQLGVPSSARTTFLTVLAPAAIWVFGFPSTSFALFPVILRDAIGGTNDVLVAGVTGTTTALAALLSRPVLGRAASSVDGLKIAMWIGVVGYVLGTIAFVTDTWQLIPVAAIALGAASGTLLTAGLAITEALADPSNRGALNATFYFATYIGMTMPVVITFMARGTSLNVALGLVTAAALLVAVRLTARPAQAQVI
ncbi:MAG: MFS transporter [Acidimicrobiia bacterium]|nr:MFS transporter [Acidimicrobiia bacterium]